jgi:molybdate transport system regulatory protein
MKATMKGTSMDDIDAFHAHAQLSVYCGKCVHFQSLCPGVAELLRGIDDSGSILQSSKRMHMAYTKSWNLLKGAENNLKTKLVLRSGPRGSTLTPEGKKLLQAYDSVSAEAEEFLDKRLKELLAK